MSLESCKGGAIAAASLALYSSLDYNPPKDKFTILASFVLSATDPDQLKVISLATGLKCLPENRLPSDGDALHDSHAEVLARRGSIRWFMEEMQRVANAEPGTLTESPWIRKDAFKGKFVLKDSVQLHMYVSTVPCEYVLHIDMRT